jgi:phosphatidate phosphatase APP1
MTRWKRLLEQVVAGADAAGDLMRERLRGRAGAAWRLAIVPYIGYGTARRVWLRGRVLKDEGLPRASADDPPWRNAFALYRRLESDEVPGARVRATLGRAVHDATADREGYFEFDLETDPPLSGGGWYDVRLELIEPPREPAVAVDAPVLVPPPSARFGVVSDIDDTVVWTGVKNKPRMLLELARGNAATRKPFKGVGALYRAFGAGASGNDGNPVFYVSSSPWNLYLPLVEYLERQQIPLGPLALKDFGDHTVFAHRDHAAHKLEAIERIFAAYDALPFVLIGDSGEQDPEIYAEVVRRHPDRVRVVYIRSIDPDPARIDAIDRLIDELKTTGAQLVLAPDSEFAAAHAAAEGLIATAALADVRADKRLDQPAP